MMKRNVNQHHTKHHLRTRSIWTTWGALEVLIFRLQSRQTESISESEVRPRSVYFDKLSRQSLKHGKAGQAIFQNTTKEKFSVHLENSFCPRNVAKPHHKQQTIGKAVCADVTSAGGQRERRWSQS